jgi:hypothetical protein
MVVENHSRRKIMYFGHMFSPMQQQLACKYLPLRLNIQLRAQIPPFYLILMIKVIFFVLSHPPLHLILNQIVLLLLLFPAKDLMVLLLEKKFIVVRVGEN